MANNFTPVGTEFQVNIPINNDEVDPDIAVMTDGRFAVVYEREFAAGDVNIRLQFVNPDGTLSGLDIEVESQVGHQFDPVVTARSGGGATVIYHDVADSEEIHFKTVTSAGTVSGEFDVLTGSAMFEPDAAALADGRVLVVATQATGGNDIVANFINAAGTATTGAHFLDNGAGSQSDAAVAAFGNNALVVYNDETVGTQGSIVARFYDGTGSLATDYSAEVAISTGGNPTNPDVATLTDGRYIVVWDDTVTDDIQGRFVDAAGNPVGDVFTISNAAGNNDDPRVAALPDGGFIVTFENNGGLFPTEDASNDAIVARRFDKNGNPAGDLFLVNTGDPLTAQDNPAIAVNTTTGEALIAWDDSHTYTAPEDNDPDGVRGRTFQTETDIVNGTDDDDVIATYGLDEQINGLKGEDRINAGDGDDLINGGKNSDKLFGEGGVDTFLFDNKKGTDKLDWEDGEALHFDSDVFKKPDQLGALKKKYFEKGKEADDGNDFFIYQKSQGKLWYDSNGDGFGKQKLIAKLDKGSDLDAGEIFLI